jgi:hypothetical protein
MFKVRKSPAFPQKMRDKLFLGTPLQGGRASALSLTFGIR